MAILSTIHNEQWPAVFAPSVGNVIGVIGIASDGPMDPVQVNADNYQTVFGKLPVDPTLLDNTNLDAEVRTKLVNKFNRSLVKTIAEIFEFGNPELPVVALRIGSPTIASLSLKEPSAGQDELTAPSAAPTATPADDPATSGYQELGLSVSSGDASGLLDATQYYFKVNGTEYDITTGTGPTYGDVVGLMDTALDAAGFTVTFETDDIRITNDVTGASSTVSIESGDTSPDMLTSLTGFTAVDAAVGGTDGSSLAAGDYYYVVTFYSAYGETTPSPEATATVVSATDNGKIDLSSIPISGETGIVGRKIYRGITTGGPYYHLTTIADDTTATWTDDGSLSLDTETGAPSENTSDVPGPDKTTLVEGSPATSLTISARAAGDEYNYFYAKINDNGSGKAGELVISYDPPSVASDTTGSINVIDDANISNDFHINLASYSLEDVVTAIQGSYFAPYIFAEINYLDKSHTFSYVSTTDEYSLPFDEAYSYDLYKVNSLKLKSEVSESIESGNDVYILDYIPYKVSSAGTPTIKEAAVTHDISITDAKFTLVGANYEAVVETDDYMSSGAIITLNSTTDADGVSVSNSSISGTTLSIVQADYEAATAPITINVTYKVDLTEAKLSAELYQGVWNNYFAAGETVFFGDEIPYDMELTFDTEIALTKGSDYTITSYGNTGDRDDPIMITVFDTDKISGITSGDLTLSYQYYPGMPAITSTARPLQGGNDGNDLTHKEYKQLISVGLRDISNYAPTDLIISGIYLDDSEMGYSASTGLPEVQPVNYMDVIDFWSKKQAYNIKECRCYIGTKPITFADNQSVSDAVYSYISKHTTATSAGDNPKALRDKYDNQFARFSFGDLLGSTSLTPGTLYNINPAVISMLMTRTKSPASSKLHIPLQNIATRVKIMDNALINEVNGAGWEFYSGITGDNLQTVVQAVTERSGAKFGTKMDSQHISDTVFMAVRLTREEFKPFQGKPATQNRLEAMRQKAISRITDYLYPEPIYSFNVTIIPRTLSDKINERTRFRIFVGVTGIMRVIVLDTYIGVD